MKNGSQRPVELLIVEDNPSDVELMLRALKRHHIANPVHVVRDGVEALDFIFACGAYTSRAGVALPKAVLLDLKLPRMNGLEVLERFRADDRTKLLPVIVLTSSREEPDIKAAYALGANSYVVKPVEFEEFVKAVSEAGLYWLFVNEPAV